MFELLSIGLKNAAVVVGTARPGQGDMGFRHQIADRCAQFVRDIGREIGQTAKGFFQSRQHVIEGLGEFGQFDRHRFHRQAVT